MGVIERIVNIIEKYEEAQDRYWLGIEQAREDYIKKYGFPPPNDHWCSTCEMNARLRRRFKIKLK